jgi:hypothetical protein
MKYLGWADTAVRVEANCFDRTQETKRCHRMPERPGVFLCIAMSPNNIKHAFVVDTRGDGPVLLDSALPTAVKYTEEAMDWVKCWQKVKTLKMHLNIPLIMFCLIQSPNCDLQNCSHATVSTFLESTIKTMVVL